MKKSKLISLIASSAAVITIVPAISASCSQNAKNKAKYLKEKLGHKDKAQPKEQTQNKEGK
ncbi:hypothetical protein BCF59_0503 [Mycoplasmopsis mustelae]|uniref:Lipoprotein n=1 Tax=Mycoplasmopsis mustelae TaxID=171289 RepID=A0A4R7UEB5_9BACT|nr:hypothetical protein [Mycoplasmopsis mustelae]TDV23514.1 hypothetical protein BCF59_0503 [Mycoplasmopsis mustelae]